MSRKSSLKLNEFVEPAQQIHLLCFVLYLLVRKAVTLTIIYELYIGLMSISIILSIGFDPLLVCVWPMSSG